MALFWSFSVAGGYIPLILRQKGIDTSQTLNQTYIGYLEVYTPGVSRARQRNRPGSVRLTLLFFLRALADFRNHLGRFRKSLFNSFSFPYAGNYAHPKFLRSLWKSRSSAVGGQWSPRPP